MPTSPPLESAAAWFCDGIVRFNQPLVEAPIHSTVVLVDPFGPHPVVMTGSHNFSPEASANSDNDLLIVENAPGLAAEYKDAKRTEFNFLSGSLWPGH